MQEIQLHSRGAISRRPGVVRATRHWPPGAGFITYRRLIATAARPWSSSAAARLAEAASQEVP